MFRFFTEEETRTQRVKLSIDPGQHLEPCKQYQLVRENRDPDAFDEREWYTLKTAFDVDPTDPKRNGESESIDLAIYLKNRILCVSLFDAESHLYFGSCEVPLCEAMRQGRQTTVSQLCLEVRHPIEGDHRGYLSLVVGNHGRLVNDPERGRRHGSPGTNKKFRKKVGSRPMEDSVLVEA